MAHTESMEQTCGMTKVTGEDTMSWTDFYRRRDAIDAVLAHAEQHPGAGLPFAELPAARAVFADRESLALALQYKWSQVLTGHIGTALSGTDLDADQVEAIAAAWRRAARQHRALRGLLDQYTAEADPTFRRALSAEQRMVAFAAGLAEHGEPADEAARIGAAFVALIRGPRQPVSRRTSVEQLFRRLVASS
jgi:hypothetical protein